VELVSGGVLRDVDFDPGGENMSRGSMVVSAHLTGCSEDMFTSKPFWWSNPPPVLRFTAAIIFVGLALLCANALEQHWQSTPYVSLFLCAIMISAWYGGFRAGLLAITLSVLAFDYFFLAPTHSLVVNRNEVPRLVLFMASALLVGLMSAAQRRTASSLRQARDSLAVKVRELEKNNETLRRIEEHMNEDQK
jgi:K+-sensing histidine kinase KdpD